MIRTTYTRVPVTTLASGAELCVPIHEVRGRDGPTFGISACLHGDEQVSTEILYRFLEEFDAGALKGRLLIVPVANGHAYEAVTRNTPLDMHNLNRVFPGGGEGFFSHRLAEVLVAHFLDKLDYYVDLHAGGAYATVDYVYITNAEALSRAFGSRVLFRPPQGYGYGGSTAHYMTVKRVPCVTVELGGGAVDQSAYVRRGVDGIVNVLRAAGMLTGDRAPLPRAGGMLVPETTGLHLTVPRDAVLGRVLSPYSFEELDILRAPFERSLTVLIRPAICRVNPGDFGYMIGDLATAEA